MAAAGELDVERQEAVHIFSLAAQSNMDYSSTKDTRSHSDEQLLDQSHEDDLLTHSPSGHYPHLDITRIACVVLVAIDHDNFNYGLWDNCFVQHWVLQYLFLVCGVCYAMSGRSLLSYQLRLGMYVAIGIFVNWTAWVITGRDWKGNMFNVVFQLWFVVGLMFYAAVLAPLKPWLSWIKERNSSLHRSSNTDHDEARSALVQRRSDRDSLLTSISVIGGGLLVLVLFFHVFLEPLLSELLAPSLLEFVLSFGSQDLLGFPKDLKESNAFVGDMCTYFLLTCSNIYLVIVGPRFVKETGLISWALIFNTYGHRILFFRGSSERLFHGLDLMMLAMTCYFFGLRHRRKIGEYVIRYWFVVLFACAILWPPGLRQRLDEQPPTEVELRARYALLEFIFVTVWLVAGENLVQRAIFEEDKLQFLNEWTLLLFLVHKAVHLMLSFPANWAVLIGLIPVVYVSRHGLPIK